MTIRNSPDQLCMRCVAHVKRHLDLMPYVSSLSPCYPTQRLSSDQSISTFWTVPFSSATSPTPQSPVLSPTHKVITILLCNPTANCSPSSRQRIAIWPNRSATHHDFRMNRLELTIIGRSLAVCRERSSSISYSLILTPV
jgi:hypothetical protein